MASNGHAGVYYYKFIYQGRFSYVNIPGTKIPYGKLKVDLLLILDDM